MAAANHPVFLFRAPYMLEVPKPRGSQARCLVFKCKVDMQIT